MKKRGRVIRGLRIGLVVFGVFGSFWALAPSMGWRWDVSHAGLWLVCLSAWLAAAIALLGLVPFGSKAKRRRGGTWLVAAACFGALGVSSLVALDARRLVLAGQDEDVRVAVYNARGINDRVDDIERVCLDLDADVLVVCEPHPRVLRRLMDESSAVRQRMPYAIKGAPNAPFHSWMVVLSRREIDPVVEPLNDRGVPGGVIAVRVLGEDGAFGAFGVVALHASSPRNKVRWNVGTGLVRDAVRLARGLGDEGLPVVVAGDLNATPGMHRDRLVRSAGLRRAKPLLLRTGTYPVDAEWPRSVPIDDVWVDGFGVTSWRVGEPGGSDHVPVVVGLDARD